MKELAWKCPRCGWFTSNTEMQAFRCDVGCPRCDTPLAMFKLSAFTKAGIRGGMAGRSQRK